MSTSSLSVQLATCFEEEWLNHAWAMQHYLDPNPDRLIMSASRISEDTFYLLHCQQKTRELEKAQRPDRRPSSSQPHVYTSPCAVTFCNESACHPLSHIALRLSYAWTMKKPYFACSCICNSPASHPDQPSNLFSQIFDQNVALMSCYDPSCRSALQHLHYI